MYNGFKMEKDEGNLLNSLNSPKSQSSYVPSLALTTLLRHLSALPEDVIHAFGDAINGCRL
jgi:hypothetical protein